ncbi:platelet glycoprotein Ib alpha chain [Puntigrus tetrazona]|uniref:platelet glycoprotein Ib alpha chain n=1 Tax=Puntigrus tetrazona TaxID=1606681 RepID=UPI001C89CAE3|nr:platelet glycoprotein Ib alpha chain [Puntigrus tetrazona]
MPRFFLLFLLFLLFTETSSICQSGRNKDHRPQVNCTGQGLTAVPDGIPTDTQVLLLTENLLTSLSWSMYSGFTELHELDLSHNLISTLEPPGPVLEKLSVLRLSGNRLTGLGGQVFRCAPSLEKIYLDRNQLRSLHDGTFSELPRLEIIDLSQNQLPALPSRLLERVSSEVLTTFDLENNSVSMMPNDFFSSKPDLPYVYLTHNPWLCSCSVSYLYSFLLDQEDNVYMHNGSNAIEFGANSVLCSGPAHLLRRPIIKLDESDFCPPDPPTTGDQDFTSTPARPDFKTQPESTSERPDIRSPSSPPDPEPTSLSRPLADLPTVSVKPVSVTQAPTAPYHSTVDTQLLDSTKSWTSFETYWVTWTWTRVWYQSWTEYLTLTPTANPFRPSEGTTEPSTWKTATSRPATTSESSSTAAVTTRSQRQETDPAAFNTGAGAREASGRLLPWCWWLFAGFLFLCLLSALTSCFLFLWLLRSYLVVYRRLKRHASSSRVTLRAYRRSPDTLGPENEAESASFLPPEQIRADRAVFRSVLFISRDEQPPEESQDVSSVAEPARDKQRVFRKTLHRAISAGEEAAGWTEEEETARYSLVLTEERGLQMGRSWLVGEWQMAGGGVACERLCSLIGQSSERTTDGQGLVSSISPTLQSQ